MFEVVCFNIYLTLFQFTLFSFLAEFAINKLERNCRGSKLYIVLNLRNGEKMLFSINTDLIS
jgi:hypothetical protein